MELHTLGQYVLLIMIIVFCSLIILFIRAYLIYKQFYKLSENNEKLSSQKKLLILHKIRGFCYNTPYLLYFLEILLPLIFLPLTFIIIDAQGQQVPYQITYDEKIIFPANVKANIYHFLH